MLREIIDSIEGSIPTNDVSRSEGDNEHPKAIQARLGHGSIAVTMDCYGHLMDGLDDQIAVRLDARAEAAALPAWSGAPRALPGAIRPRPSERAETLALQGFPAVAPTGFEPALPP